MKEADLEKFIKVRQYLIEQFENCREYKGNNNAIMREMDHARIVHKAVVMLDNALKEHVKFS